MTVLPQNIKEVFYKALTGEISIADFEQWVYDKRELEKVLNLNDYLDLISLDYRHQHAQYKLNTLLERIIDISEFETYRILELLKEAQRKTEKLPFILMDFYDLYCHGYFFMDKLGFGYGLDVEMPRIKNTEAETWHDLTHKQQQELLESFSPGLEDEIARVINLIETKQIILTGVQDNYGHYEYKDMRGTEKNLSNPNNPQPKSKDSTDGRTNNKGKSKTQWWKFWK